MLYEKYYAYGIGICYRYACNKEEAVEILNDSFMKVFDNIDKFDENQPFRPWFRKIIINRAIDYYRANMKHNNTDSLDDEAVEIHETATVDELELKELMDLLNGLPEMYRLIFNLYEMEGYTHQEISEKLGISESTSRADLSRAKQILRKKYRDYYQKNYEQII
jgi:RNA polymerase sigma-70 factor (ECF subfamily)